MTRRITAPSSPLFVFIHVPCQGQQAAIFTDSTTHIQVLFKSSARPFVRYIRRARIISLLQIWNRVRRDPVGDAPPQRRRWLLKGSNLKCKSVPGVNYSRVEPGKETGRGKLSRGGVLGNFLPAVAATPHQNRPRFGDREQRARRSEKAFQTKLNGDRRPAGFRPLWSGDPSLSARHLQNTGNIPPKISETPPLR